jgi:hypothetical protein
MTNTDSTYAGASLPKFRETVLLADMNILQTLMALHLSPQKWSVSETFKCSANSPTC